MPATPVSTSDATDPRLGGRLDASSVAAALRDPDPAVRAALLARETLDAAVVGLLAGDPSERVRLAAVAALEPDVGPGLFEQLARDPSPAVRVAVIAHPHAPPELVLAHLHELPADAAAGVLAARHAELVQVGADSPAAYPGLATAAFAPCRTLAEGLRAVRASRRRRAARVAALLTRPRTEAVRRTVNAVSADALAATNAARAAAGLPPLPTAEAVFARIAAVERSGVQTLTVAGRAQPIPFATPDPVPDDEADLWLAHPDERVELALLEAHWLQRADGRPVQDTPASWARADAERARGILWSPRMDALEQATYGDARDAFLPALFAWARRGIGAADHAALAAFGRGHLAPVALASPGLPTALVRRYVRQAPWACLVAARRRTLPPATRRQIFDEALAVFDDLARGGTPAAVAALPVRGSTDVASVGHLLAAILNAEPWRAATFRFALTGLVETWAVTLRDAQAAARARAVAAANGEDDADADRRPWSPDADPLVWLAATGAALARLVTLPAVATPPRTLWRLATCLDPRLTLAWVGHPSARPSLWRRALADRAAPRVRSWVAAQPAAQGDPALRRLLLRAGHAGVLKPLYETADDPAAVLAHFRDVVRRAPVQAVRLLETLPADLVGRIPRQDVLPLFKLRSAALRQRAVRVLARVGTRAEGPGDSVGGGAGDGAERSG